MTATYDITTAVGKVRRVSGDKDLTDVICTDEEITYFLSEAAQNVDEAAAMVLEAWAATYTATPSTEKIGDYSYAHKTVENMLSLAAKLRAKAASIPVQDWGEMDLAKIPTTTD